MADITNELIFEVLMQNQLRLTNVENRQIDTSAQLVAIPTDVSNIHVSLAHFDERTMRIERRLDVADQPAS